jgi:hypothetical protein
MKDNNLLCSQLIQNPSNVYHNTCEHDEREMFFLSLAKTIIKLAPAEQPKVKMGVSEIVFPTELNSTKNTPQLNNNYQFQHLPSPSTIDSSGTFSSAANTPTHDASPVPQQEYDMVSFFRKLLLKYICICRFNYIVVQIKIVYKIKTINTYLNCHLPQTNCKSFFR